MNISEMAMPAAVHMETTVLGSMMMDPVSLNEGLARLRDADFSLDSHRQVYRAIRDVAAGGKGVDYFTVREALEQRKQFDAIGGPAYLASLTDGIPRNPNNDEYLRILRSKSSSRTIMEVCNLGLQRAADISEDPQEVLSFLSDAVTAEIAGNDSKRPISVQEHTREEYERWTQQAKSPETSMGLRYGNSVLDAHTNGMQPGEVTVVGARSGVGKTVMLVQAAHVNCSRGGGADLFSLEAPAGRILRHMWAIESEVPYYKVRKPHMCTPEESKAVRQAMQRVSEFNLRIYDKSDLNVSQISAYARLGVRQHGSTFIGVDYAQIVDALGRDDRIRVSNVSKTLTRLAKDEGVSLMLLSQLAKVSREFYGKAPTINDLRETGQLENDAHIVLLLHRWYDQDSGRLSDDSQIIIPKMRDGEPGVIASKFDKRSLRFL